MAHIRLSWRNFAIILVVIALTGLTGTVLLQRVAAETKPFRTEDVNQLPHERVAVVFGASIDRNGDLSPILQDRVDMGIQLYKTKKVEKLLMSGDNRTTDYNEVSAMQRYAISHGVPEQDITLDYAGFSTYETCYRAKAIFGLTTAILVSQRYHIPRALYACRSLGIDAYGIELPDWEKYPSLKERSLLREEFATYKMLWDIHVTKPKPTFLGKFEGIK